MATTIQIKRSSTASAVPLAGDLEVGELAVNLADKRLFTKKSDGTVVELSTNPTDIDIATLRIDGVEVTASAAELNSLDGSTASTADLNKLAAVTATSTELNVLDGFTGSTAELNILDGVTATTAELNILDGITATTTELNYVDGVTSNIQTQLDGKASSTASPTITLGGDLSGSATLTNLGNATLTATVADDSHNHIISNVDGLQTALDSKAPTASPTFTGTTTIPTVDINGGNIDGAVIGSSEAASGQFTTLVSNSAIIGGELDVAGTVSADGLTVDGNTQLKGDVSFYEDTGTTAKMVWDASAESLVVGGSDDSISGGSSGSYSRIKVVGDVGNIQLSENGNDIAFSRGSTNYISALNTGGSLVIATNNFTRFDVNSSEAMRIDSAGNVGIGTASPTSALHIKNTTGNNGLRIETSSTDNGYIHFADADNDNIGRVVYSHSDNSMAFVTSDAERARLDSSGNLLVGKTSADGTATEGSEIRDGRAYFSASSGSILHVNRNTTDGEIIDLRKDSSTVGSIGTDSATTGSNSLTIDSGSNGIVTIDGLVRALNTKHTGTPRFQPVTDNFADLGNSGTRFKDLYLSGGVYLGGTGAVNKLDDYETGSWTPTLNNGGVVGTSGSTSATYTKIGNRVFVRVYLVFNSIPSDSSDFEIDGLPFVAKGTNNFGAIGTINYSHTYNTSNWRVNVDAGDTFIYFHVLTGSPGRVLNSDASGLSAMIISASYETNS